MPQIPTDPYPFHHTQPIQMRFNDLDALGHVNNTIYLEYLDYGKTSYITQVLKGHFNLTTESLVIVNINCSFFEISRYGEELEVLTRADKITDHTVTLVQRVINPATGHVKVECRSVMVGFSIGEDVKMPISPEWRQLINNFEGRELYQPSNHNTQNHE